MSEVKQEQPLKPKIDIFSIHPNKVRDEVTQLGLKLMTPGLMDAWSPYYYTDERDWAKVFSYIYTVFPMPPYLKGRMDSYDFGILLKGLVSAFFGLNYYGFIMGEIPEGGHGWGFFRTQEGPRILEPLKGEFFRWGERGYKAEWVLL